MKLLYSKLVWGGFISCWLLLSLVSPVSAVDYQSLPVMYYDHQNYQLVWQLPINNYFDVQGADNQLAGVAVDATPTTDEQESVRLSIDPQEVIDHTSSVELYKLQVKQNKNDDELSHKTADATVAKVVQAKSTPPSVPASNYDQLFQQYAEQYGISSQMLKDIAHCESGFNENAINGVYGGMFQFVSSTWRSNRLAMGLDPDPNLRFNAEEAIKTAAFKMSRDGYGAWPACAKKALLLAQS